MATDTPRTVRPGTHRLRKGDTLCMFEISSSNRVVASEWVESDHTWIKCFETTGKVEAARKWWRQRASEGFVQVVADGITPVWPTDIVCK